MKSGESEPPTTTPSLLGEGAGGEEKQQR